MLKGNLLSNDTPISETLSNLSYLEISRLNIRISPSKRVNSLVTTQYYLISSIYNATITKLSLIEINYKEEKEINLGTLDLEITQWENFSIAIEPFCDTKFRFIINANLRKCYKGETQIWKGHHFGPCFECEKGTYSLNFSECVLCNLKFSTCNGGLNISVNEGYYRERIEKADQAKVCKIRRNCLGGSDNTTKCSKGYQNYGCQMCDMKNKFPTGLALCKKCWNNDYILYFFDLGLNVIITSIVIISH